MAFAIPTCGQLRLFDQLYNFLPATPVHIEQRNRTVRSIHVVERFNPVNQLFIAYRGRWARRLWILLRLIFPVNEFVNFVRESAETHFVHLCKVVNVEDHSLRLIEPQEVDLVRLNSKRGLLHCQPSVHVMQETRRRYQKLGQDIKVSKGNRKGILLLRKQAKGFFDVFEPRCKGQKWHQCDTDQIYVRNSRAINFQLDPSDSEFGNWRVSNEPPCAYSLVECFANASVQVFSKFQEVCTSTGFSPQPFGFALEDNYLPVMKNSNTGELLPARFCRI